MNMKTFNNVLLFSLAAFAPSSVTATCDAVDGAELWDGNGHYYKFVEGSFTWLEAEAAAEASICGGDGYLATIASAEENAFVSSLFDIGSGAGPWLGGFQPEGIDPATGKEDVGWEWVTGELWDFTDWHVNEPNDNQGMEDCLHIFRPGNYGDNWNDETCSYQLAYVLEFSATNTFHIGECDTGIFDPAYNLCDCDSTAEDAMAACTTPACVEEVGLAEGLAPSTITDIVESYCPCEIACPVSDSCGTGNGQEKFSICHNGDKQLCIAASAWPAHCREHGDTCGPCE
jgi:hypothetical protein